VAIHPRWCANLTTIYSCLINRQTLSARPGRHGPWAKSQARKRPHTPQGRDVAIHQSFHNQFMLTLIDMFVVWSQWVAIWAEAGLIESAGVAVAIHPNLRNLQTGSRVIGAGYHRLLCYPLSPPRCEAAHRTSRRAMVASDHPLQLHAQLRAMWLRRLNAVAVRW
jgi:hypothetical protein